MTDEEWRYLMRLRQTCPGCERVFYSSDRKTYCTDLCHFRTEGISFPRMHEVAFAVSPHERSWPWTT